MANSFYDAGTSPIRNHLIYNFFNLYNLPEYHADEPKYGGFLPLVIYTTTVMDDFTSADDADVGDRVKKSFVLPMAIGQITDSVSVTYSNKSNKLVNKILGNAVAAGASAAGAWLSANAFDAGATIGEEASKYFMSSYDAGSLNKRLDVDFILPVMSRSALSGDFVSRLYTYLGALEGMIYPSNYGFGRPPAVKVEIGGMYKGFKAFIEGITIRSSEELIKVGDEMIPLVYYGSIKFINVWMYAWDTTVRGTFNLTNDPSLLFGVSRGVQAAGDEAKYLYGSINGYDTGNTKPNEDDLDTRIREARLRESESEAGKEIQAKVKENLRNAAEERAALNWQNFNINNSTLGTWSAITTSSIKDGSFLHNIQGVTNIYNAIKRRDVLSIVKSVGDFVGNDTLYGVGLDGFSPIYNAYKLVERALDVNSVDSYLYTAGVLLNSGVVDDLLNLGNVTKATNTGFNNLISSIGKIFNIGSNFAGNSSKEVDLDAVAEYYSNPYNISGDLNDKSKYMSGIYNGITANTLLAQNMTSLSNKMMKSINSIISTEDGQSINDPLGMLVVGGTYGIANSLASGLEGYKKSFDSMYNVAEELYADKKILPYEYSTFKQMYDIVNEMDLTYLKEINPTIEQKMANIANALEEAGV